VDGAAIKEKKDRYEEQVEKGKPQEKEELFRLPHGAHHKKKKTTQPPTSQKKKKKETPQKTKDEKTLS